MIYIAARVVPITVSLTLHIDPHVHSEASYDGTDPVELILEQAAEIGLDAVVITDHDAIEESLRAADLAPLYGLVGIPGVEVSTAEGHLLAIGVEEMPPTRRPYGETIEWVHDHGGVAIVPHPFQRSRHGVRRRVLDALIGNETPEASPADGVDGGDDTRADTNGGTDADEPTATSRTPDAVEVYNSWLFTGYKNRRARRFADAHGYPGVAASDAHTLSLVGRAYTELTIPDATRADLDASLVLDAICGGSTEVQGRRTPIPVSARHYAIGAARQSGYYAKLGALRSGKAAKAGAMLSGKAAKTGALLGGRAAKTSAALGGRYAALGAARGARLLSNLSPLSRSL
ncbi:PHP-associated domain-containing protein [Haloprofundus salilacus]|uniref:PHP-associated domain-containing protein n=1 Tax=Haloprofundus salilacus TaxID=2876190 RepID=UPI001CCE9EBF|nr:PHP domain-containing protein [Haloprofundus salilacus]